VIEAIAIVTRDRPQSAGALARALAEDQRARGRSLPIVVADDSRESEVSAAIAAEVAAIEGVAILGAAQRSRLVDHLVAAGCERDVVEFAVGDPFALGITPGANRNFVRLWFAGCGVAILDDDVRLRGLRPPDGSDAVSSSHAMDPSESWFFDDRDAFSAAPWSDVDVVGELDRALALPSGGDPPIALAGMGLAGDLGTTNALVLLASSPGSRARLFATPSRYDFVRRSRILMRTVRSTLVCDGGPWNPAASAYAGAPLLPPFLPVLRGQGPAFGATIRGIRACSVVRVPWALEHRVEADDDAAFDRVIAQTARPGAAAFVHMLVATSAVDRGRAEGSLVDLGQRLVTTGELPFASFKDVLAARLRARQATMLRSLGEMLDRYERMPAAWAADVESCMAQLREVGADPLAALPHDLEHHAHPHALLRELVLWLGRLYCAWPQMMLAARSLPPAPA